MFRTPLDKAHLQRSFRPLYGWTQMTPKDQFLDPEWDRSVPIYPGMVAMKTTGEQVTLIDGTGTPLGFFGHWIGGEGIDELRETGVNSVAVWVMAADAEAEIDAPAFDPDQVWAENTDGTPTLVYASTAGANRGQLVPAGAAGASAQPVARLLRVNSDSTITIGGLQATDAAPAAP